MSDALERFYSGMFNNVVLRDDNGRPSIFVRHVKQLSSEFDSSLPAHTHPAFICGGVEDDSILIGKYLSSELAAGGTLYSLPNAEPAGVCSMAAELASMRAFGHGVSGMTIADHGLLVLMAHAAHKLTYGNTQQGSDYRDGLYWRTDRNTDVALGDTRTYNGYTWRAKVAHTITAATRPDVTPSYWERVAKTGGTIARDASPRSTLTGSGPVKWSFLHDPSMEADIGSNGDCWLYGLKLLNGEIQILPDNDAADPDADLSASSSAWRAILPTGSNGGYELVTPGTEGTVHYRWANSKITLVAGALPESELVSTGRTTPFNQIVIDTNTLPDVPSIIYELGLAPLPTLLSPENPRVDISLKKDTPLLMSFGRNQSQGDILGVASYRTWPYSTENTRYGGDYYYFTTRPRARVSA